MNIREELLRYGPARPWRGSLADAHNYCAQLAATHYENFTVATRFVPAKLRTPVATVYAWCRWADDLADETGPDADLLLTWWQEELTLCFSQAPRHPVTVALAETVRQFQIPPTPFERLLKAFHQDQHCRDYTTFDELVRYCELSANPVGELVLYLYQCHRAELIAQSDATCTALQLANFWQDVARDRAIGRIYLPREDRERFGVTQHDLDAPAASPSLRELLQFQVDRTREWFARGAGLPRQLPRPARLPVRLFTLGGVATLEAIQAQQYDVLTSRPTVSKRDKFRLALRALFGY